MAVLRTTQFAAQVVTGTAITNLYTVPTGHRIILRSVQVLEVSGVATDVQLRLSGVGTFLLLKCQAYPNGGAVQIAQPWIAFDQGQTLQIARVTGATAQLVVILSGSLLFI